MPIIDENIFQKLKKKNIIKTVIINALISSVYILQQTALELMQLDKCIIMHAFLC